jgi:biotin carboxyl carrier protein
VAGHPPNPWLGRIREVLEEVLASDATEFELCERDLRLRVSRRPWPRPPEAPAAPAERAEEARDLVAVSAPLTGVFYESPSPGARPFVRVGDWVDAGGVIGLIEAMKVFNEVTMERAGAVVLLVAADGALVQAGDPLLYVDPDASPPPGLGQPGD